MAVKVMVVPVEPRKQHGRPPAGAESGQRPTSGRGRKRRRSSVYDAEGNEVFITLICLKCQKIRPLSQFGLRRMADGAIRNQPWCRPCRSAPSDRARADDALAAEAPTAGESPAAAGPTSPGPAAPEVRRTGSMAAEVAAALAAGRG